MCVETVHVLFSSFKVRLISVTFTLGTDGAYSRSEPLCRKSLVFATMCASVFLSLCVCVCVSDYEVFVKARRVFVSICVNCKSRLHSSNDGEKRDFRVFSG